MEKIIEELSYELWKTINQLDRTFDWELNWFYYNKTNSRIAIIIAWANLEILI